MTHGHVVQCHEHGISRDVLKKCPWRSKVNDIHELSDSFKQLDTVGMLRYKEKLGMLGVTTDPYRDVWPAHKVFSSGEACHNSHKGCVICVNHDSSNSSIEAQNLNKPTPC